MYKYTFTLVVDVSTVKKIVTSTTVFIPRVQIYLYDAASFKNIMMSRWWLQSGSMSLYNYTPSFEMAGLFREGVVASLEKGLHFPLSFFPILPTLLLRMKVHSFVRVIFCSIDITIQNMLYLNGTVLKTRMKIIPVLR